MPRTAADRDPEADEITMDQYQELAGKTAIYPRAMGLLYTALGLSEEVGEVLGKVKRIYRDDEGHLLPARRVQIRAELGDALWYLAMLAAEAELTLNDIALENLKKLQQRKQNNKLKGEGDLR
jgi:NTP pyrophosphatase (non-canonical NTP hydrolase)